MYYEAGSEPASSHAVQSGESKAASPFYHAVCRSHEIIYQISQGQWPVIPKNDTKISWIRDYLEDAQMHGLLPASPELLYRTRNVEDPDKMDATERFAAQIRLREFPMPEAALHLRRHFKSVLKGEGLHRHRFYGRDVGLRDPELLKDHFNYGEDVLHGWAGAGLMALYQGLDNLKHRLENPPSGKQPQYAPIAVFNNPHVKNFLKNFASGPELEKVNLRIQPADQDAAGFLKDIAHSNPVPKSKQSEKPRRFSSGIKIRPGALIIADTGNPLKPIEFNEYLSLTNLDVRLVQYLDVFSTRRDAKEDTKNGVQNTNKKTWTGVERIRAHNQTESALAKRLVRQGAEIDNSFMLSHDRNFRLLDPRFRACLDKEFAQWKSVMHEGDPDVIGAEMAEIAKISGFTDFIYAIHKAADRIDAEENGMAAQDPRYMPEYADRRVQVTDIGNLVPIADYNKDPEDIRKLSVMGCQTYTIRYPATLENNAPDDPMRELFVPEGYDRSLAELAKAKIFENGDGRPISHEGRFLAALRQSVHIPQHDQSLKKRLRDQHAISARDPIPILTQEHFAGTHPLSTLPEDLQKELKGFDLSLPGRNCTTMSEIFAHKTGAGLKEDSQRAKGIIWYAQPLHEMNVQDRFRYLALFFRFLEDLTLADPDRVPVVIYDPEGHMEPIFRFRANYYAQGAAGVPISSLMPVARTMKDAQRMMHEQLERPEFKYRPERHQVKTPELPLPDNDQTSWCTFIGAQGLWGPALKAAHDIHFQLYPIFDWHGHGDGGNGGMGVVIQALKDWIAHEHRTRKRYPAGLEAKPPMRSVGITTEIALKEGQLESPRDTEGVAELLRLTDPDIYLRIDNISGIPDLKQIPQCLQKQRRRQQGVDFNLIGGGGDGTWSEGFGLKMMRPHVPQAVLDMDREICGVRTTTCAGFWTDDKPGLFDPDKDRSIKVIWAKTAGDVIAAGIRADHERRVAMGQRQRKSMTFSR